MNSTLNHRFAYRGWNISIRLDRAGVDGPIAGAADLQQDDRPSRRIVVDEPYRYSGAALRSMAQRARSMVDDCETGAAPHALAAVRGAVAPQSNSLAHAAP